MSLKFIQLGTVLFYREDHVRNSVRRYNVLIGVLKETFDGEEVLIKSQHNIDVHTTAKIGSKCLPYSC